MFKRIMCRQPFRNAWNYGRRDLIFQSYGIRHPALEIDILHPLGGTLQPEKVVSIACEDSICFV